MKAKITNHLIDLLDIKTIHQISVTEIVDNIGISRMTFYRHFSTKYDILEQLSEKILKGFIVTVRKSEDALDGSLTTPISLRNEFYSHTLRTTHYLYEHRKYILALSSEKGQTDFIPLLRETFFNIFFHVIKKSSKQISKNKLSSFYISYVAWGIIGVFEEWMRDSFDCSPEEIAGVMADSLSSLSFLFKE